MSAMPSALKKTNSTRFNTQMFTDCLLLILDQTIIITHLYFTCFFTQATHKTVTNKCVYFICLEIFRILAKCKSKFPVNLSQIRVKC